MNDADYVYYILSFLLTKSHTVVDLTFLSGYCSQQALCENMFADTVLLPVGAL